MAQPEGYAAFTSFPHVLRLPRSRDELGISHIAALPLFSPTSITGFDTPAAVRRRLELNVQYASQRLFSSLNDDAYRSTHSVAFPAIGSTSQRGGDSSYFLSFREGFLSLVKAIEHSHPPPSLDRVYFVAFEKHKGVFLDESLSALADVRFNGWLKRLTESGVSVLMAGLLGAFYLTIAVILDLRPGQVTRLPDRWSLADKLIAGVAFPVTVSWGGTTGLISVLDGAERLFWPSVFFTTAVLMSAVFILWRSGHGAAEGRRMREP